MRNGELNHAPNRNDAACPYFDHKNKKYHPAQRDRGSTTDADPGRAGRVEQGEAPPGKSAPIGGPQLELSRKTTQNLV